MDPLSRDSKAFLELLNTNGVEFLIVGAWAVGFHGRPRQTGDLDVFVKLDALNAKAIMQTLTDFGFGSIGLTEQDFTTPDQTIQLGRDPNRIDILTTITGVTFEQAWAGRVAGILDGLSLFFIGLEDLLINKRSTGRPKDRYDVSELEQIVAHKAMTDVD